MANERLLDKIREVRDMLKEETGLDFDIQLQAFNCENMLEDILKVQELCGEKLPLWQGENTIGAHYAEDSKLKKEGIKFNLYQK